MEKAPRECILCGRTERVPLMNNGMWSVHKCMGCGLGVLDPRPDPSELCELYRETYFIDQYDPGFAPGSKDMTRRLSQESHRIRFFRSLVGKGVVLDLGCGRGYFLAACRERGYEVKGYDVSEDAAAYVRSTLEIPVETGDIREGIFPSGSAEVVTMWHALEHTPDPRIYLDLAGKWLAPNGCLVVEVPNHEGLDARWKRERWEGWQLPYHFFHFTPSSLRDLLSAHGFEVVAGKTYHSECLKQALRNVPVVGWFARPIAKLFPGTSYAVVAKKRTATVKRG
jgi:2-polyprenyl-3-methyl-5-hydroxy-6-metoxy-1,4-benzoquinol methylase